MSGQRRMEATYKGVQLKSNFQHTGAWSISGMISSPPEFPAIRVFFGHDHPFRQVIIPVYFYLFGICVTQNCWRPGVPLLVNALVFIKELIFLLKNLHFYWRTYIFIEELIFLLKNLYFYWRTYIFIEELIFLSKNLYFY